MKHASRRSAVVTSILMLFALIATACGGGGGTATATAERDFVVTLGPTVVPLADEAEAVSESGVQYGATLDEWAETTQASASNNSDYPEISWEELIPVGASGAELIARFEERLDAVEPGSEDADILYAELQAEWNPEAVDPMLDGQKIRLAGFVAPLTYEDDIVTEFLLVPTFGACIHVPPPPANQTVMVSVDKEYGLTLEESWGAVWVEGTMQIESGTTDLGATSYRITDATSGPYDSV